MKRRIWGEVDIPGKHGEGENAHEEVAGGEDIGRYGQGHCSEGE